MDAYADRLRLEPDEFEHFRMTVRVLDSEYLRIRSRKVADGVSHEVDLNDVAGVKAMLRDRAKRSDHADHG